MLPQATVRLLLIQRVHKAPVKCPNGTTRTNHFIYNDTPKNYTCQEISAPWNKSASQARIKRNKETTHKKMPDFSDGGVFHGVVLALHFHFQQFLQPDE